MEWKDEIKSVLNEEKNYVEDLPMLPLKEYSKFLDELGVHDSSSDELLDITGWDADFTLHTNDREFFLTGSLYYGKYKFTRSMHLDKLKE